MLYGWHPVSQALANAGRHFHRLLATENALARLKEAGIELPIEPEMVRPSAIDRLLGPDAVHQGLYAEAEPLAAPALDAMPDDALLLALDQITDPHNVGAIVRTAAAFGVTAIVTTARHSPNATGVLAKSASGGLEHVPLVIVRNLAEALITLGEGWHNNHHAHPRAANAGLAWYEIDMTSWIIRLLERMGLVWNVRWAQLERKGSSER